MKKGIWILWLILGVGALFGQGKSYYFPITIGAIHYQSKDEFHSPLRYRGWGWMFRSGLDVRESDRHEKMQFAYFSGNLRNGAPFSNSLNLNSFQYRQHFLPALDGAKEVNWFLGATLKIHFSSRSRDRVSTFDAVASLGITAAATYQHRPTDRADFDAVASLPLLGWGVRPRFASHSYENPPRGDFWGPSHLFLYFPKLLDLDTAFGMNWSLENNNFLRLEYDWRFYQILPVHRVRVLEQGLNFSALMNL